MAIGEQELIDLLYEWYKAGNKEILYDVIINLIEKVYEND